MPMLQNVNVWKQFGKVIEVFELDVVIMVRLGDKFSHFYKLNYIHSHIFSFRCQQSTHFKLIQFCTVLCNKIDQK